MRPLIVVIALAACNAPPFDKAGDCTENVFTEDQRDCECLNNMRNSAVDLLQRMGHDYDPDTRIWIKANDNAFPTSGGYAWGQTITSHDVILSRWSAAWAHEMLHVFELNHGVSVAATAAHTGWEERGWLKATLAWESAQPHCQ